MAGAASFTAALSGRSHRDIGRVALVLLFVGAVTSVPVALAGSSSMLAKAAFLGQASTLAVAIGIGWRAGRRGDGAMHRRCMSCAALALSGAPLSRLALKVPNAWLSPEAAYASVAWFAWLGPFALAGGVGLARRRAALRFDGGSP